MAIHGMTRQGWKRGHYINMAVAVAALAGSLAYAAANIYPAIDRAPGDIDAAIKEATAAKKRVIVEFGGNWCGDCIVLDKHFQAAENAALLKKHYVLVHVNVGDKGITDNFPVAERYGIPLKKGVPALAVLDSNGKLVFAQKQGEFESMRKMDPSSVREFLEKWAR